MNLSRIPDNLSASDFNFTDCKLAGTWGAKLQLSQDLPLNQTSLLLYNGLTGYLAARPNVSISKDDSGLFVWFLHRTENNNTDVLYSMIDFLSEKCGQEYCQRLTYEGFSDLTGRGMMVNFFLEAGLVTAYLLVFLAATKRGHLSRHMCGNPHVRRFVTAIQESTRTFLDAALIFCIALLLATIKTYAYVIYHPEKPYTTYSTLSSGFLSFFSIIPAFLLHLAASEALRRVKWRRFVWGFIVTLTIVMVALYYNLPNRYLPVNPDDPTDPPDPGFNERFWEISCEDSSQKVAFGISLFALGCAVFGTILIYAILFLNIFRIPLLKPSRHKSVLTFRRRLLYVIGAFSFVAMWAVLGLFMYFRHQLGKLAGNSNKDHEWSFGQILALATWLPVVVELGTIWIMGPEHGLTGQMSRRYRVVENEQEPIPGALLERKSDERRQEEGEDWSHETLPLAR